MNKIMILCVLVMTASCTHTVDVFQRYATAVIPMKLGEGTLSSNSMQWNNVFVSSTNEIFYTKSRSDGPVIKSFILKDNKFIENESFNFPNNHSCTDIFINAENTLMLFSSNRNVYEGDTVNDWNIWKSVKLEGKWQSPELFFENHIDGNQFYPWLTKSGNLYFSITPEGSSNGDLYVSKFENDNYLAPKKLSDHINTSALEGDAFVAPDESYMIFAGFDRVQSLGKSDLYISFNIEDTWTAPVWLGADINSDGYDGSPFVTQDGKYLIFTSSRGSTDENIFFNHYMIPFDFKKYKEAI